MNTNPYTNGDDALEATNTAVGEGNSTRDGSFLSGDPSEDPTGAPGERPENIGDNFIQFAPRHVPRTKIGNREPTSYLPNLTPGARRIP